MTQKRIRAALYVRTSTTGQGNSVSLQMSEMRQMARQRGWDAEEYVDEGVSGSKDSRPALDRMMDDARTGKFDLVAAWKLDRLGRSLGGLLHIIADLQSWSVGFISLTDSGIDTTSPQGRLLLQLLGAFAEFERSLIRERVQAGVDRARRKGKTLGRPRRKVDVKRARQMIAAGRTQRQVAMALRVPRSTLRRALERG